MVRVYRVSIKFGTDGAGAEFFKLFSSLKVTPKLNRLGKTTHEVI